MHTRVSTNGLDLSDDSVIHVTRRLLESTRAAKLDVHEGTTLPDLALLAELQHHGAATPLLDVSLDPLVALYMAVVSPNGTNSDHDGVLFAIKKPAHAWRQNAIEPYDTRSFESIYQSLPKDTSVFYRAPDVSDRLRIQRGYFLISRVCKDNPRITTALTLDNDMHNAWISQRMNTRGRSGPQPPATTDVAAFRIPHKFKPQLQDWLEERTGLTEGFVYPTIWHQPHQEAFAKSQGRLSIF